MGTNLDEAKAKYNKDSSEDELRKALQDGAHRFGLHAITEEPLFLNYIQELLNERLEKESSYVQIEANKINRWLLIFTIISVLCNIIQFLSKY